MDLNRSLALSFVIPRVCDFIIPNYPDDNFSWALAPLPKYELSSRPKRSEVEGPAVLSTSQRTLNESATLPFVIPSAAESLP
jgi:hypothetical protein